MADLLWLDWEVSCVIISCVVDMSQDHWHRFGHPVV